MKITFFGHAVFLISGSKRILIDPFIKDNPLCPVEVDYFKDIDAVIVTHDHTDHMGDAIEICRRTGAVLYGLHEISLKGQKEDVRAEGMNIGGKLEAQGFDLHLVFAIHTSSSGGQCGVVVEMDGKRIYHAGDTGLFGDMKLIGDMFKPDVAMLPIGDRYTMGIDSAVRAVEMIKPQIAIPMHYNTWPVIKANPEQFRAKASHICEIVVLQPGKSFDF